MPSQNEKLSSDERMQRDMDRARTRSFAGYLKDRALKQYDFEKDDKHTAPAKDGTGGLWNPIGSKSIDPELKKELGLKKGGAVKKSAPKAKTASKPASKAKTSTKKYPAKTRW